MGTIAASPRELLRIRRDTERTFEAQVEIWRIANGADGLPGTPDGKGSRINTFARLSSGPGRIVPLSNREGTYAETVIGERLGGRQPFMVTVAHDRVIRMSDQARIDGRNFEIVTTDDPRTRPVDRRVVVAEIS